MGVKAPEKDDDGFLTTEEVAARYRTVPSTVRYWRHIGTGPKGTVYGRRVLYRESDLREWEHKQEDAGGEAA
ncbi:hypothetical protein amrb99_63330 [Actinomadura sp. RB99]|uniref:helix-turn-helix transcriptional regulator n=1 Tax=Actinomadura sp. RB99 TaxID=2691577 RepID=UPI001686BCBA|nr:helix-turn-helix domain-containing protein [Actinomadura sp. RB99]MBD2897373.1 hypothetical protein [Actinomadura sp. RB99]